MLNEHLVAPAWSPFSSWKPPAPERVRQGHFPAWATPGAASRSWEKNGLRGGDQAEGTGHRCHFKRRSRTSWGVWLQAPLSGLRGAGDRKGPGFVRGPATAAAVPEEPAEAGLRAWPGSGSPQPRRRLRGSEAAPLPSAESCALPGASGGGSPSSASGSPPPAARALPASFLRAERDIGESWRAPAGAVRREGCNRAEEDAETLLSTAVQHRNISASLKQRDCYMGGSTEHFWASKDPLQSTSRKGRPLFSLMRKICQVSAWFD
uniref:uncharacterized protein n=1 Tax=Lonchura striata TaxID=40157 RepID=UPI0012932C68|nr:uncharacterized protein LOC110473521 [Lonchura striata domestica]